MIITQPVVAIQEKERLYARVNDFEKMGLTVSQAASPLSILAVLFLSEVAYCARAAISSALRARL